jgi:hypothetical protein
MTYLGFLYLDHPTFSPDQAPSDYHLFPGLKKTIEREVDRAKDLSAPRYMRRDMANVNAIIDGTEVLALIFFVES